MRAVYRARPALARAARARARGRALERPGARAAHAGTARLGPDILAEPPDRRMVANLRREHQARELGDALLDQRLVAGIGNMWKAESLWRARSRRGARSARYRRGAPARARRGRAPDARAARRRPRRQPVYRRAGRPCPRCGTPSAPAARATTTAPPTGVRAAKEERRRRRRVEATRGRARSAPLPAPSPSSRRGSPCSPTTSRGETSSPFAFEEHASRGGRARSTSTGRWTRSFVESRWPSA